MLRLAHDRCMTTHDAAIALAQFVIRARRIGAHSIVQDEKRLRGHSEGSFSGSLNISGTLTMHRELPPEEVFESLAARVRPLTIAGEPIYYAKVFDAIERLMDASEVAVEPAERDRSTELRRAWEATEIQGTQIQVYAMQVVGVDGSNPSPMVSDTQLAAGWLYADLVHADPKGPKRESLLFPMKERYAAAVRVFSRLAALSIATLRFVEHLRERNVIKLDPAVWQQDVVVDAAELVEQGSLHVAPVGTALPDLREAALGLSEEWSQFTVTDLLRNDPTNQVTVILRRDDETVVARYDAAVARRWRECDTFEWDALVAGCVIFPFRFRVQGDSLVSAEVDAPANHAETNRLILAQHQLWTQIDESSEIAFEVQGSQAFTLRSPKLSDDYSPQVRVLAEVLADIVKLEALTGQVLNPCTGAFDDRHRVRLRQVRLMLEGHVVQWDRGTQTVTSRSPRPPQVAVTSPSSVTVGGCAIPIPTIYARHPHATTRDLGPCPEAGPEAHMFELTPPEGERFRAWSPDHREVRGEGDQMNPTAWELIGIDEKMFPL